MVSMRAVEPWNAVIAAGIMIAVGLAILIKRNRGYKQK